MKKLRDQIFDDLQTFVREREKHHWRIWDKYKYAAGDTKPHLKMYRQDLDAALHKLSTEKV